MYFFKIIYPPFSLPSQDYISSWPSTGVSVFCQCHLSVVPIYSCMKKRTVCEFTKTLVVAMVLCVFAYTGTASFGYLTFGSAVNEDVLLSYKPTPDVLVAVILVAIKMYTTLPILLFVGRWDTCHLYFFSILMFRYIRGIISRWIYFWPMAIGVKLVFISCNNYISCNKAWHILFTSNSLVCMFLELSSVS